MRILTIRSMQGADDKFQMAFMLMKLYLKSPGVLLDPSKLLTMTAFIKQSLFLIHLLVVLDDALTSTLIR